MFKQTLTALTSLTALTLLATLTAGCADAQPPVASAMNPIIAADAPSASSSLETFTSDSNAFDTHSFWIDTGREVVVFDAQFTPDWANRLIAEIHAKTKSPIRWVVVTHPNPDKFNGVPAFQAIGAKAIASEATAKAIPGVHAYKKGYFVNVAKSFTDATYPAEAKIDVTFNGDYDLPLLEGTSSTSTSIKLHELQHRGVSSTQTVAFIPRLNALVVGDVVHHRAHAWLEGGIVDGKPVPDLASWKLALDELRVYSNATVYGGRGESATVDAAVNDEQAYLDRMTSIIIDYVKSLGDAKSEIFGPDADRHYKAIEALAVEAFPDYALGYMIEYGVYGLLQQIAAAAP